MSMTFALRRLVDPSFASASEEAKAALVFEHAGDEQKVPGDLGDVKVYRIELAPRALRCRLCGLEGHGSFCLRCLADTLR